MATMPDYLYSPNAAARARQAVACASHRVTKCQRRLANATSGSDRREALRSLRSAERHLAEAEYQLARAEDKRPGTVTP